MNIVLPYRPGRKIGRLYAVVSTDTKTGLEGLCCVSSPENGMAIFQATMSNRGMAERLLEQMLSVNPDKTIKLKIVEFTRVTEAL